MKARTREQKKVLEMSDALEPISERAKRYAYEHCFAKEGRYWKTSGMISNRGS